MSLVGSLEDLGLGDILQIVSLSRKSGLLKLRSDEGEGRIVFHDGLVRTGTVKGEAEDLKDLLVSGGFVDEDEYGRAASNAEAHGDAIDEVLADSTDLTREMIDSLRREHVERSVFAMFGWSTGEFSFEVRDEIDPRDGDLMLPIGINPQYLTIEASRIGDEDCAENETDLEFGTVDEIPLAAADDGFDASCDAGGGPEVVREATEALALAAAQNAEMLDLDEELGGGASDSDAPVEIGPTEVAVVSASEPPAQIVVADDDPELAGAFESTADEAVSDVQPAGEPAPQEERVLGSAIVIDPDLTALEWQKLTLDGSFQRIHIFQAPESGIARLRQYMRRGEMPSLLVADAIAGDPANGYRDPGDLLARLKAHASSLPIFVVDTGADLPRADLPVGMVRLRRPRNHELANRRAWPRYEAAAGEFCRAVNGALHAGSPLQSRPSQAAPASPREDAEDTEAQRRLKRTNERLRDPSAQGEVLSLIVEFAAESFSRVAVFMVRDDDAIAMVQSGLDRAGGPSAAAFEAIRLPAREPDWFREVLVSRRGTVAPPQNDGDQRLAELLGGQLAGEAYVAPIESGDRVVALVYVDNLPGGEPIGDTASLEIVLREAGLALERALHERAEADAAR